MDEFFDQAEEIIDGLKQSKPELYRQWVGFTERSPGLAAAMHAQTDLFISTCATSGATPEEITSFFELVWEVCKGTMRVEGIRTASSTDRNEGV